MDLDAGLAAPRAVDVLGELVHQLQHQVALRVRELAQPGLRREEIELG